MFKRELPRAGPKKAWPTAVIIDTQSVKNAATATRATVGFDAGKLVKGRKRLVLTDTLGNVLASRVLPAGEHDGTAAIAFWDEIAAAHALLGRVQVVFVDSPFNGAFREHLAHRSPSGWRSPCTWRWKRRISAFMPGAGLWNEPLLGSAPTADYQKNTTTACALPMPGLP